jgi:hypothetical protein
MAEHHRQLATIGDVPRPPADALDPHDGAARLSSDLINTISRFPDDNPNPVMRFDADGHLIYANPASAGILRRSASGSKPLPEVIAVRSNRPTRGFVGVVTGPTPSGRCPSSTSISNLYGMDVTAERAIPRFTIEINPLFRFQRDGRSSTPTRERRSRGPSRWPSARSSDGPPQALMDTSDGRARPSGSVRRPLHCWLWMS